MQVLGCRSRRDHLDQVRRKMCIGAETWSALPRLHALALSAQVAPMEYARAHSMLPSHRVAAKAGQIAPHGSEAAVSFSRLLGMETQKKGGYVCLDCIADDLATARFTWFRRAHHLTGVDWCWEHGTALSWVDSTNPFDSVPHLWRSDGKTKPMQVHQATLPKDGLVRRFVDIAIGLLSRPRPVSCTVLNGALAIRARKLGLRISEKGAAPLVSDRLMDQADADWLVGVGSMENKRRGTFHNRIDIITKSPSVAGAGESYALVLATLFDSAQDALAVVSDADSESQSVLHGA